MKTLNTVKRIGRSAGFVLACGCATLPAFGQGPDGLEVDYGTHTANPTNYQVVESPPGVYRFHDPNAITVNVDGADYNLEEALGQLTHVLAGTNSAMKVKWLKAVALFRTDLQGDTVTTLIEEFRREPDAEVRRAIQRAVSFSRDPRFTELYLSGKADPDPGIRGMAGFVMIEQKDIEGVEVLTRLLPELDRRGREVVADQLNEACALFGLDYGAASGLGEFGSKDSAASDAAIQRWTDWWDANKQRYMPDAAGGSR